MTGWFPADAVGWIALLLGVGLIGLAGWDMFHTVILPRASATRITVARYLAAAFWPLWRRRALAINRSSAREQALASFGPLGVVAAIAVWVALLVTGYGLAFYGLRQQLVPVPDLPGAIYLAGASVLTIGFGDITPVGIPARFLALTAAALGLGTMALGVTYLFSLYASFQRRETLIVRLEARAGAPPSGVALLEDYAAHGEGRALAGFLLEWEIWAAEVLDSHVAYPILAFFRSSHDNVSWVSALGAVLDASSLLLTTVTDGPGGEAEHVNEIGNHCVEDIGNLFGWPETGDPGVEESEFTDAHARLVNAGWSCRPVDEAWAAFRARRASYAGRLNAMALFWLTPPAPWIGDRSVRSARH